MFESIVCFIILLIYALVYYFLFRPVKLSSIADYFLRKDEASELIREAKYSIEIFVPDIPKSIIFKLNQDDLIEESDKVLIYCCQLPSQCRKLYNIFTIKKVSSNRYVDDFINKKISFILIDREKYIYLDGDEIVIGNSFEKIKEFGSFLFCARMNSIFAENN